MTIRRTLAAALLLAASTFATQAMAQLNTGKGAFEVSGLGGAGGMLTPSISPFDSNFMLVSCDMSGDYRSVDGAKTWEMIHHLQLHSSLGCRPAFTKDAAYWKVGSELKMTRDKGLTWTAVTAQPPWKSEITHIAVLQAGGGLLLTVGTGEGVWSSTDGGKTWAKAGDGKCAGMGSTRVATHAVIGDRILSSADGAKWDATDVAAAKDNAITSLTAGTDEKDGNKGVPVFFLTVSKVGIVRVIGAKEEVVSKQPMNDVLMASNQTQVAYANDRQDILKTEDGGATWKSIFHMTGNDANVERAWVQTQLGWGYAISPLGLGVDAGNPNVVLVSTQGDFYRSTDGGKKWYQVMVKPLGPKKGETGDWQKTIGLEVTSVWGYVFDPIDVNRRYICYTDIGFARTVDKGDTYSWSARGCPWSNTFYEIAFDPAVKGRIYAANSSRHDIPHWTHVDANRGQQGGVCVSDDYGATWKVLTDKLPKLPCTGIVIDPKSPQDKLTMYATFYEGGVYKTTDGGKTWEKKSEGLGNPGNLHCYKVRIHPKTGNLYCLITAMRVGANKFPVNGGIWKSTDGGDSWTDITATAKLAWPTCMAMDPADENTIYVTAATIPGSAQGGLYKTTDGGKTWKHILTDDMLAKFCTPGYTHGMVVLLHPQDPKRVYFGSGSHALWYSKDAGETFVPYKKFPFKAVQNVTIDPHDPGTIYVSTFGGGVWKGPAEPVNEP